MVYPMKQLLVSLICIILIFSTSCTTESDKYGNISIRFSHEVNGIPLETDTLKYQNEAENYFSVSELKYFISDFVLVKSDGSIIEAGEKPMTHYVDHELPETMIWMLPDSIPAGVYKSISFTFGLDEETNHNGLFTTPPEYLMQMPDEQGGGYYYMQMKGKYANIIGVNENNYEFFLGIGQIHPAHGFGADETTFVHNHFTISINNISFELDANEEVTLNLTMEIENWLRNPHTWNFYTTGGHIATNQDAQIMAKENGIDVFSAQVEEIRDTPRENHQ